MNEANTPEIDHIAMLDDLDDVNVGPVEPDQPEPGIEEPAPPAEPEPAAPAAPTRADITPAIADAKAKRALLIAASEAVLRSIEIDDGTDVGVGPLVEGMNRILDRARTVLGSVFSTPARIVERLEFQEIDEGTATMYSLMRAGEAFKLDPFVSFDSQVTAWNVAHKAWTAASRLAIPGVQAAHSASRGEGLDRVIIGVTALPEVYVKAREAVVRVSAAMKILKSELANMGDFAEAYEQAIVTKDWKPITDWQNSHKLKIAQALVAAHAEPAAPTVEQEPQEPQEPDVLEEVPVDPSEILDDDILTGDAFPDAAVPADLPVIAKVKTVSGMADVDMSTGEIVSSVQDHAEPAFVPLLREALDAYDRAAAMPETAWTDLVAKSDAFTAVSDLMERAADAMPEGTQDEKKLRVQALRDAADWGLYGAELMRRAADAMPDDGSTDQDPMGPHHDAPVPRVSHVTDDVAPRNVPGGFDLVALAHKHFVPIAGVAAVLVLGVAFMVGHRHRAPSVPVSAPVAAPVVQAPQVPVPVVPAPASAPAPVASVPSVTGPASVPTPRAASVPVVQAPAAPVAPKVVTPAPAPAAVTPSAPAPVPHVAKPVVHKPVRPVEHERVTTLHDTNQALDQLRAKLGE